MPCTDMRNVQKTSYAVCEYYDCLFRENCVLTNTYHLKNASFILRSKTYCYNGNYLLKNLAWYNPITCNLFQ